MPITQADNKLVSPCNFGKCREILTKCREAVSGNAAKNRQIAAAWMVLSLLQEQGSHPAVAGEARNRPAAVGIVQSSRENSLK